MKTTKNLLLTLIITAFSALGCSIGIAQTNYLNSLAGSTLIYSNVFSGGAVDINGTVPTYINPSAPTYGGSNNAAFVVVSNNAASGYYAYQGGTLGASGDSVLLPFTPVTGYVYTVSASLTFASIPPASGWGALGYGAAFPHSNASGDPRFGQPLIGGNPWALLNYAAQGGGAGLFDTRSHEAGNVPGLMSSLNTPYTINLVVDTTGTQWHSALIVAGTPVKDALYATKPTISSIGYGQTTTAAGAYQWNSLTLSASPLVITKQPVSANVAAGAAFTNTVVVAAVAPIYQWFTNGVPITGATNASLIFNPVTLANAGTNYYVVITNSLGGAATSAPVSLAVYAAPAVLTAFPVTYTNPITLYGGATINGTNYPGSTPTFSVSAIGQAPFSYQWFTNGVAASGLSTFTAASGTTNSSFTFTNCQLNGPTTFAFVISNAQSAATNTWAVSYLPTPTVPFIDTILSDNPAGFWRLNEQPDDENGNEGAIANDYASGNNGLYTNVVLGYAGYTNTDPTDASVRFNYYDNHSDAYGIQGIDFSNSVNATFTVQAWAKGATLLPSGACIIAKGYNGGEQFALDVNGNKYRFLVRNAAGTASSVTAATGPDNNWHFIVGVCNEASGSVALYVDGLIVGSTTITAGSGMFACATPVSIGARGASATENDSLEFSGYLSDVVVYPSALSSGQVAALYGAAGYSLSFTFVPPLPPTNFVFLANKTLTIPATVFGPAPMGFYWTNLTAGGLLGSGQTNISGNLNATLTIPNASASLSGDQLELVVTNAANSTNWFTSLFSPAPPVTLSYTSPILYSNYFNGGTWSIAGMPLTAANSLVGGTNTTWVDVLGTNDTTSGLQGNGTPSTLGDSWLVPFTPQVGYIYTLTADLTFTGNPGSWVGVGFAQVIPTNATAGRFGDIASYAWDIQTISTTENLQGFQGPGGTGPFVNANGAYPAPPATYTNTVVLDTTGTNWTATFYVDSVLVATTNYATIPPIGAAGITQNTLSGPNVVQLNYWSLSQVAPGGVAPYLLAPQPSTNSIGLTNATVTIAATAFGSAPLGYYWINNSTIIASGLTNNMAPLPANLSIASSSLSAGTLALVVTNAYGTNTTAITLVSAVTVNPNPGPIQFSITGNQLTLGWPTNLGWTLQVQTNNLSTGLSTNWVDVSGSTTATNLVVPVNPANGSVFYRLHN